MSALRDSIVFAFPLIHKAIIWSEYRWVSLALGVLSVLVFLAVLMSRINAAYKLGWVILIGAIPLLGSVLYLLFGNHRPSRRLNERIAAAERYIFFEYFIVDDGEMWEQVKEILVAKAQAGVDVRVMYDEFGCLPVLPRDFERDLTAAGARVQAFNPLIPTLALVMNNRDHRKIMVIDGRIAYTGGFNIADEYINLRSRFGHWKDTGLRLVGPVAQTFAWMIAKRSSARSTLTIEVSSCTSSAESSSRTAPASRRLRLTILRHLNALRPLSSLRASVF